jgi:hypothetical protein
MLFRTNQLALVVRASSDHSALASSLQQRGIAVTYDHLQSKWTASSHCSSQLCGAIDHQPSRSRIKSSVVLKFFAPRTTFSMSDFVKRFIL